MTKRPLIVSTAILSMAVLIAACGSVAPAPFEVEQTQSAEQEITEIAQAAETEQEAAEQATLAAATIEPTDEPTVQGTIEPTEVIATATELAEDAAAIEEATEEATAEPATDEPTTAPTNTTAPPTSTTAPPTNTVAPTNTPTDLPATATSEPTVAPTDVPPTAEPTEEPTAEPTEAPTEAEAAVSGVPTVIPLDERPPIDEISPDDPRKLFVDLANPQNGEELFYATACNSCHYIDQNLQLVGPPMYNVIYRAADRVEGEGAYTYLYNSIRNSQAYIVDSSTWGVNIPWNNLMPVYGPDQLSDTEIYDIISWIIQQNGE